MSDTPETEAQLSTFTSISKFNRHFTNRTGTVSATFARRLERQRDEARLSLKHALEAECADCASYKQERDKAQSELDEWHHAAQHVDDDHPDDVYLTAAILRKQLNEAKEAIRDALAIEWLMDPQHAMGQDAVDRLKEVSK
jgi:hypothetical protein